MTSTCKLQCTLLMKRAILASSGEKKGNSCGMLTHHH